MRRTFFIGINLTIMFVVCSLLSWADIYNGLISHWPLNNNLVDITGHGYNGEMINGTVSYVQGVNGNGIKLPGSTDSRISIAPWVPGNSSVTVSGWVKISNLGELWREYMAPIYGSQDGSNSHSVILRVVIRDYTLKIEFNIEAENRTGNTINYTLDTNEFYGKWHHMAGVVDREKGEMKIYYDGNLVTTSNILTTGAVYPTKGFIGSYDYAYPRDGATRFVSPTHCLDEIRLYNRVLSSSEISELFLNQSTFPIITTNSVSAITMSSAVCGSSVEWNGGAAITSRGICWSTSRNPTIENSKTVDGSGPGTFTSSITGLSLNTTYYVRAYATCGSDTYYGSELSFTTEAPLNVGLIAYYPFNGNANDESGNGNHATVYGNTTLTTDRFGIPNKAYYFDGDHDYLQTGSSSTLRIGTKITFAAWVNLVDKNNNQTISVQGTDYDTTGNWGVYVNRNGQIHTGENNNSYAWVESTNALSWNNWHFIAVTFSSGTYNIYIDGELDKTFYSGLPSFNTTSDGIKIGEREYTPDIDDLMGKVDEVRIYNRTLSANEIRSLYLSDINNPSLTTNSVSAITTNSAVCGGNILSDGGVPITSRGVCWSISPHPTTSNSKTVNGSGIGSFTSNITGLNASTTYYVRAYATNSIGTFYGNEYSFTTLNDINILSPNGSETFTGLTSQPISWSTTGTVSNVKIEYSTDGGTQWTTIVASISNTNSYNWNVSDTPSTNCKIRISDASTLIPSDTSDGTFTILPAKTISVLSPNGTERLEVGTTHQISWNYSNLTGNVRIDYTTDNGTTSWTAITYSTPINTPYNWLVPDTISTQCKIRVTSLDVEGVFDESNNTFSIYKEIASPQRAALIALYNATNGDNWTRNSGWKTPPLHTDGFAMPGTENSWYGISFAANNVYQINLQNNNLKGVLPDIFADLFGLHFLYLNNNNLTGNIPASIGTVTTLEDIKLNNNRLTGSIPSSFNALSMLQYLDLSSNQLSGNSLVDLSNLSVCQSLNLAQNGFTFPIPSWIGSLTGLTYVDFSNNLMTGNIPSQIGNLSNLRYLDLRYNKLEGEIPTTLTQLQNLTSYFDINYNALYSNNSELIAYLNGKDQNWQKTQTVAPKNVNVSTVTGSTVTLNWDAISFTDKSGGYDVYYSTTTGGPYTMFGSTSNKLITTKTVTGLQPATPYYFVVKARTEFNTNRIVISGNSEEVPAITAPF